ncbi:sigma-70 family RNA polymerase sigma factor [Nocardioides panacisoli]|uniref:RNA polymerase sigma factor n=1 Tax=Nocardioides panacisoli TaxID=627624 RepID=UPI001C62C41C|nr:sigma-70 family RNA polymerase sigma factor [Nocardioides panacisoli]QYJ02983.1 sigma-70 family RNA polymerase sigma factor [Nocardioides panacisoli]
MSPGTGHATVTPLRPGLAEFRPPSDAELLEACRAGDAAAWDQVVERYQRLIYSVALRNGLSGDDAADITQTTFVELVDALDRFRDDDKLASWLMTVARRQAWQLRTRLRRVQPSDSLPEESEDPFSDWGTLTTLHDALAELGGKCRDLLHALYFDPDEPSYAEIADRMGRSIGSIGPLRGRCLLRLRKIVGEDVR